MEIHYNSDLQFKSLDIEKDLKNDELYDLHIKNNDIDKERVDYFISKYQGNLNYSACEIKEMINNEKKYVYSWFEQIPSNL